MLEAHGTVSVNTCHTSSPRGVQWGLPPPHHPPVREVGLVTSQGHVLTEQSTPSFLLCGQQAMAHGPHPAQRFFVNKAFWNMQMFQDICSFTENLCLTLCQDNTASSGAAQDPVAARKLKILTPRTLSISHANSWGHHCLVSPRPSSGHLICNLIFFYSEVELISIVSLVLGVQKFDLIFT